jgi:hypothetical protein
MSFFHVRHRGHFPSFFLAFVMKRLTVKFHLIPGSLKGRAYLKRIFMGKLIPLPHEITEGMADYEPPY